MRTLVILLATILGASCGVVGTPVPPDYVGVAPTVEKQKRQHAQTAGRETIDSSVADPFLDGHDMSLPPSQPVGTR